MGGKYWEDVVYAQPPLERLERCHDSVIFNWISEHFPVYGTKIHWSRVRENHSEWKIEDDAEFAARAAEEVRRRIVSGSLVEHVGDGLSPYGVRFGETNTELVLRALLEIPEHHYFVDANRAWPVVATTEGYLDAVDHIQSQDVGSTSQRVDAAGFRDRSGILVDDTVSAGRSPRRRAWMRPSEVPAGSGAAEQVSLVRGFVRGDIDGPALARSWLTARRRSLAEGERLGKAFERVLTDVFYALDDYVIDPQLRESHDLSDADLLRRVGGSLRVLEEL